MTPIHPHPYPAYKDSGIVWLGKIPAHWTVTRLKSFATVQLSNVDKKSKEGEDKVRLCNYVDVYYNERIDKRIEFMPATATSEQIRRFSLQSGDVLITKDSETWTDIAVPAVVSEDLPSVLCGYHLAHIRPGQHCIGGFLSRLFAAIGPRDQYHISANGITRFGLTGDSVRAGVFALPPLPEQRAIAAFLDRETARIDALVDKKERLIELLQEKRAALISHAVTRGLPADAAAQAGLDSDVPTKVSGVEWLGEIPANWEIKRLKYLATVNDEALPETTDPGMEIAYVDIGNVDSIQGITDVEVMVFEDAPSRARRVVRRGDVIVSTVRTYLRAVAQIETTDGNLIVSTGFAVLRPRQMDYGYVAYVATAPYFVERVVAHSVGVSYPAINPSELTCLDIILPPLDEQCAIAAFLDRETAKIDTLTTKVREAIERLKELRVALISAAVTGEIDVRNVA